VITERAEHPLKPAAVEKPMAPRESRWKEFWRLLRKNRLALLGLFIFVLFFLIALAGLFLTSGTKPFFDPAVVRLEEKLRPPLSSPKPEISGSDRVPRFGLYLLGTDELGRDVFSRMVQGAWVSLTVGFVAVGIAVLIGILLGGISGYYGQNLMRANQIFMAAVLLLGAGLVVAGVRLPGIILLAAGLILLVIFRSWKKTAGKRNETGWTKFLWMPTFSIDTLIMRFGRNGTP
jgi:ABC-type dipeptide/oligopeptide/nickel transport system permease subunit